ncbi:glycosyltransferase [Cognaticolwellia beringensis]|uniref:Glycosyltransferase family 2 protein n=1 Tax=Cognaticolwellia beringensis TaxID=1967665 RepID=A0A222G7W7_9GAMM|nr:glycosyltransferase family A protein [Cognaticolwellia beringensis]ASP47986.1 glycosyltransferase family 2 protein [Cognaticolwellia beringensis]
MKLSIVFATFKSEAILDKSLRAYCNIITSYQWELIIVDNACRVETRQIIEKYKDKLPIVFLEQPQPGKNNALNKALPSIQGELVMFTDNDIIPASDIIDVYVKTAKKNMNIDVFGGKILPNIKLPKWIDTSVFGIKTAFGILDGGNEDKEIPLGDIWGGNMLVRQCVFKEGVTFNTSIGPNGKSYIMGSETEFLGRLSQLGYSGLYVSKAIVLHQIRDEQLSINWLAHRAFRAGKGAFFNNHENAKKLFGFHRYLLRKSIIDFIKSLVAILSLNKSKINIAIMQLCNTLGKLSQSRNNC